MKNFRQILYAQFSMVIEKRVQKVAKGSISLDPFNTRLKEVIASMINERRFCILGEQTATGNSNIV